jgi:hypothetical protein
VIAKSVWCSLLFCSMIYMLTHMFCHSPKSFFLSVMSSIVLVGFLSFDFIKFGVLIFT